jgi:hypothetical protein
MQASTAMRPAHHLERLSLEGMARARDSYSLRIAVEVVVGSVSSLPSTTWTTTGY